MKIKGLASLSCFVTVATAAALRDQKVSYDGYKVVRVSVGDEASHINDIVADLGLTTWKGAPKANSPADIVVPPEQVAAFHSRIGDLEAVTMHEDLGASMKAEGSFETYAVGSANMSWFNSYHSYKDHLQFLDDLRGAYPNNTAIVTSGESLSGRPITGLHIFGESGKAAKKAVIFHGTVHAREWISTMTVEYLAYQLLSKYSTSGTEGTKAIIDQYDFYIFPVVNPDGFLFTQSNDRLWRKNRQVSPSSDCIGRDINRNWPFQWAATGGASMDPCAQDYKGTKQGDAPETAALASWMQKIKDTQGVKVYMDFHSYSQYFMAPYGYSCMKEPKEIDKLLNLASDIVERMNAVHGTNYQSGSICTMLYQSTGTSVDYANDVLGAEYSYTLELRDQGMHGFVLPPAQILPTGEETWAGIRYMLANMK